MSLPNIPAAASYPIPFYTTTTTTLRTTTSATIGAILHLTIPTPSAPIPTSYTTLPLPTSPESKFYPNGLPILIMTELNAVVYDPSREQVVSTVTTIQKPSGSTGATERNADGGAYLKNDWSDWTGAERAGVIAGIVIAAMFTLGMLLWCCCRHRAWGRGGDRKRRRRRGMKERGWWRSRRTKEEKGEVAGLEDPKQKEVELESDPGGKVERKDGESGSPKRLNGLPEISVSRGSVGTIPESMGDVASDRRRDPPGQSYQMSGALQIPSSPAPTQQRSLVSVVHRGAEDVRDTQLSSEASGGRTSAYRAMRNRERREERERAYLQDPLYAHGQHP